MISDFYSELKNIQVAKIKTKLYLVSLPYMMIWELKIILSLNDYLL
jgi:hypothetical protein